MDTEMRHFIIAVHKDGENYSAILSSDSVDRDGEFMAKELIQKWANDSTSLPMLANHDNSMQSFIGGWTDRKVVDSDGKTALVMKSNFFSKEANPLAQQIKTQIDEASKMGINVGVSVGFIPKKGNKTSDGYMHTEAELVESSVVPVQSNRDAYMVLAKRFRISGSKRCDSMDEKTEVKVEEVVNETAGQKEDPASQLTALNDAITALAARISALEASDATGQAEAAANAAKAEEAEKKRAEQEKSISKKLDEYREKLEAVKKVAEQPKGKVPAAMTGNAGVSKNPEEKEAPYSATVDFLKRKGIEQ